MQPDGSLSSVAKVGGHLEKLNRPRRLEDQALAIRALLASSKRLDLPLLRWAALDIYYGMNRNFFREARQFYSGEVFANGSELRGATANEIVLALLAGEELSETMPLDVRAQWNSLSKPWIRSLQDF